MKNLLKILRNIPLRLLRFILKRLLTFILKRIERRYVKYYPLDPKLITEIKNKALDPPERIKQLNEIRTSNILVTMWSNAGTILALLLAILSLAFSICWSLYVSLYPSLEEFIFGESPLNANEQLILTVVGQVVVIMLIFVITVTLTNVITPYLVHKILYHLPSRTFAEVTLSQMNQSQMLTYVSFKMWELCNIFLNENTIPSPILELMDRKTNRFNAKKYLLDHV